MATTKAGSPTKKTVKKMPARAPATKRATAANKANQKVAKKVASKKAASATPQQATRSTAMTASKRPASKVSTRKPAAKKAATQRGSAVDHAPARTSTAKTVGKAARKMPASASATASSSQTSAPPRKATSGDGSPRKPRKITPQQALANTRELLEAKHEHDRQPQPWQALDPQQSHVANAGFQSPSAMEKAEELHAGESRQAAIQGSISTQDRHNQGKRDNR